jgi:iron complex outermembrane recepter protein
MSTSLKVWLRRFLFVSSVAVAPLIAPTAIAAGADNSSQGGGAQGQNSSVALEEIVVTATRRELPLSKVPDSVATLGPQSMEQQDVRSIADIARLVPGVNLASGGVGGDIGGWASNISIRGISSVTGSATTGVYIDDTPVQVRHLGNASTNLYPQVFDLERIEVLRGPQGTLFGAGAEGGAIRFLTEQPSFDRYSAYARTELANTEDGGLTYEGGMAVGGPIVQNELGFRVSAWYRRDGGYVDWVDPVTQTTLKSNGNSVDDNSFRGAFGWKPMDRLVITFSALHETQVRNGSPTFDASLSDPSNGEFRSANYIAQKQTDRFTLPSINVRYNGTGFDVISNTSYLDRYANRLEDYTPFLGALLLSNPFAYAPGQSSPAYINDAEYSFSQEVRVQSNTQGRWDWLVGAFYSHSNQAFYQTNIDPYVNTVLGFPLIPNNGSLLFADQVKSTDKQIAGFGQVGYELLTGLKLIAGVRVSRVNFNSSSAAEGAIAGPQVLGSVSTQSEKPVLPKYGVSYQVNPENMLYATVSKGFRIGGVNGPSDANCADELASIGLAANPETYKSDSVWSYEVGSKSRLLNDRLVIYASAYDIEWSNIQRLISLANCGGGFVTNLGNARSRGADLEIASRPIEGLTLGTSFAYTDARLTQNVFAGTSGAALASAYGLKGDPLGVVPWSLTASVEYEHPINNGYTGYGRIDIQHVSGTNAPDPTVVGVDPEVGGTNSYNDLSIRLGTRRTGWNLSVFANNILNESPIISRWRYSTAPADQFFIEGTLRPRTYGLTASYRY